MYKQTNKRNVLLFYSFTPPSYKCCRDNYYNYWSNRIDLVITPHSIAHIWTSAINELLKLSEHANQWADLCPLLNRPFGFWQTIFLIWRFAKWNLFEQHTRHTHKSNSKLRTWNEDVICIQCVAGTSNNFSNSEQRERKSRKNKFSLWLEWSLVMFYFVGFHLFMTWAK